MSTLTLDITTEAAPSRMGGATGAAARPSLLDRLIDERRRGDCADRPRRPEDRAPEPAPVAQPAAADPTGRSLDDLVTTAWTSLGTAETAACFVCGGDLRPRYGAGARPVGARCTDCGSELS